MYFILQSNSTKYNRPFEFISFLFNSNFLEEHHILSPEIWSKTFTVWFRKCSDGYIFSNPTLHRMGNASNILCPRCKELFKCNLISLLVLNWTQKKPFWRSGTPFSTILETLLYNSTSFLRVCYTSCLTSLWVLIPYSHKFKSFIYTKTSPNFYHHLIHSSSFPVWLTSPHIKDWT